MCYAAKHMVDATKHMADAAKHMADAAKPMADATKPMADATKPMADAAKRMADAAKRMADLESVMADLESAMADWAVRGGENGGKRAFPAKTDTFQETTQTTQPNPMATPLTWNARGAKWTPRLKWNGLLATNITMKTIAVIDFTSYVAAELESPAQVIHDKMLLNAATFDDPPVGMPALATLISTYHTKLAARASNDSDAVLAFNLARHDLEVALHDLGVYVNYVAKGDPEIVAKSGFPSYDATRAPLAAIPAAPTNIRLRNGDLPGSVVARIKPDRANSMNIAQANTGDPNNEAGWHTVATFPHGKVTISGLTVASILWLRFATVGAGGVIGAWSDPARIVVQ
jgi:hypothetical protein